MTLYDTADALLMSAAGGTVGTTTLWQPEPVVVSNSLVRKRAARLRVIHEFFDACVEVFLDSLSGKLPREVLDLLLNDTPPQFGTEYHQSIPRELYTRPVFFRTDEARNGDIFELQCPGSGWGDLQLMRDTYLALGIAPKELSSFHPSQEFARQLAGYCGAAAPTVLNLIENASSPVPMRYHMFKSQPPLRYWGYEKSATYSQVDFVRSHSFFGMAAENYFSVRLKQARDGLTRFDLPPVVLFDQKAPLALPFWDLTRDYFSDEVRMILVYTTPVSASGFRDVDGRWETLENFVRRPPRSRHYYVKYAGSDVARNWGSRTVFRLAGNDCEALLKGAAEDGTRGAIWVIQPERSGKDDALMVDRQTGSIKRVNSTSKWSTFYGPDRLIGIKTMHRAHFKVHGQDDTIIGLANTVKKGV